MKPPTTRSPLYLPKYSMSTPWTSRPRPQPLCPGRAKRKRVSWSSQSGSRYAWFTRAAWCDETIKFSPTEDPDACAGWNSFTFDPPNDAVLRKILEGNPNYPSPPTTAGETVFNFIGGNLSQQTFDQLIATV